MFEEFFKLIRPVAMRMKINRSLSIACVVFVLSFLASLLFATSFLFVILTTVALPITFGLIHFFFSRFSTSDAAKLVDRSFHLKNRVSSAYELLEKNSALSPISELQVQDAITALKNSPLQTVTPISRFKILSLTIFCLIGLVFSFLLPGIHSASPNKVTDATKYENLLDKKIPAEDLIEQILDSKIENAEKLSLLSKLKSKIENENQNFTNPTNAELWERIARALEAVPETSNISKAIRRDDFEAIKNQIEQLDYDSMTKLEHDTIEQNFERISKSGDSELNKRLGDVSASLKTNSPDKFSTAMRAISKLADQHNEVLKTQKKIERINKQINLAKNVISNFSTSQNPNQLSPKELFKESNLTFELENSVNSTGSKITGDRNIVSTTEKTDSPDNPMIEYQRQMEQIIENEKIPAAYRETVKNYFEELHRLSDRNRND